MLREEWMNVVWIVVDCLRRDRLGAYGCPRVTTPHLDRLATQGVRFDQCISPHIPTQPAHTTFFTGKDVFAHQIVAQGGKQELDPPWRRLGTRSSTSRPFEGLTLAVLRAASSKRQAVVAPVGCTVVRSPIATPLSG